MSDDFFAQLAALAEAQRALPEGAVLFHQGDRVRTVFVVTEGLIELTRHQRNGGSIVLQRAAPGSVLAEASVYSARYHCDAVVAQPARVREIPKAAFLSHLRVDEAFATLWTAHLARAVQAARHRAEILTRKTVAERLDGWLDWHGNELPEKGQWKGVAVQIGVSPEALYRELARRRTGKG